MAGDFPPGWEVPSLSFLKDEPLIFRVPRKQAASTVVFGGSVFLPALKLCGLLVAIAAVIVVAGLALLVLRWLHSKDPHWFAHLTGHRYPLARWTGD